MGMFRLAIVSYLAMLMSAPLSVIPMNLLVVVLFVEFAAPQHTDGSIGYCWDWSVEEKSEESEESVEFSDEIKCC